MMKSKWQYPLVLLFLSAAMLISVQPARAQGDTLTLCEYDAQLRAINLPLVEVWTIDGVEPTATIVTAPEGMWGTTLRDNEYVYGRMRMSINGETIYDSGDSGMRIRLRGNSSGAEEKNHIR